MKFSIRNVPRSLPKLNSRRLIKKIGKAFWIGIIVIVALTTIFSFMPGLF